jgi:hypothetical protein
VEESGVGIKVRKEYEAILIQTTGKKKCDGGAKREYRCGSSELGIL